MLSSGQSGYDTTHEYSYMYSCITLAFLCKNRDYKPQSTNQSINQPCYLSIHLATYLLMYLSCQFFFPVTPHLPVTPPPPPPDHPIGYITLFQCVVSLVHYASCNTITMSTKQTYINITEILKYRSSRVKLTVHTNYTN